LGFPLIAQAVGALKAPCLIGGEAIAFEDDGLASFELLRATGDDAATVGRCHGVSQRTSQIR
jgi:ATP-dependent DNA ligase